MSGNSGETLEEATISEESQANFARSFVDFLKQHRAELPTLPEMFEKLIDMESNDNSDTQNSRREDEQPISEKRKIAELQRRYKKKLAEKDERIGQLENELEGKEKELEKLSTEEEEKISSWRKNCSNIQEQLKISTDGYFKEVDALNQEKGELMERISLLQDELRSKDMEMEVITANKEEQIQEYRDRFERLKEQYESASSKKDQDLKELNFSNEDLTQQIRTIEEQLKECEAKYNKLTEECKVVLANKDVEFKGVLQARCSELRERCKHIVERKDEELKDMKTRYNQLIEKCNVLNVMLTNKDEELKGMQARHSEFKEKWKVHVGRKDEELKQMKTRLACLSEKQAQKDQRKVEDTTSSNRPSDVEKDFAAFFDGDRMDACEKMQEVYGSEEESEVGISYPRLACMIFETAYEEVKETKEAVLALFKVITNDMIDTAPIKGVEYVSKTKSSRLPYDIPFSVTPYRPEMEYPVDVFDALVLSLKETAHKCDLTSLEQGVTQKIKENWLQWLTKETSCRFSFSEYLLKQLRAYINACIRLTWRMVTQVPPMQLDYQSTTLKDIHKNVGYLSDPDMSFRRLTTEGKSSDEELEIACYLWPALLDGGRKLIRVGEVVCKVKEDITMI